jgi:hypothetical protein
VYDTTKGDTTTTATPQKQNNANTHTNTETTTSNYYYSYTCYQQCQTNIVQVIDNALAQHKLQVRSSHNKTQFEIFSADFMVDTSGQIYLIECNFTPVLYDPEYVEHQINVEGKPEEELLTTKGLKAYHHLYKTNPERLQINDHAMIRDAMRIVFDGQDSSDTKWDRANEWSTLLD